MATKTYEQMTKAELLKAINFFKLEGKVLELGKAEDSLINADYVKVLNDFKVSQDAKNGIDNAGSNEDNKNTGKKENEIINNVPQTREEKIALASEYNLAKRNVIITDHDNNSSYDADDLSSGYVQCWGNKTNPGQSDVIYNHGQAQYVSNGAISAMSTIYIPTNTKNATSRVKKRFSIIDVDGWTQEKIDELIASQKLKGN